jgi:hypothetical protein
MLRHVAVVKTDFSEEHSASIIRGTRIGELGTTLALFLGHRFTLMMEAIFSSETSVLRRATRRNIPDDGILHSRCRESLKSYIALTGWALYRRRNVFPMKYELGTYIAEDGNLRSL